MTLCRKKIRRRTKSHKHKKLLKARKKVNIPNIAYQNQHIDIAIPHGSKDCARYRKNYVESDLVYSQTSGIVKNIGRALARKMVLMLG